jgi:thiamine biosynthesis lipoprotein
LTVTPDIVAVGINVGGDMQLTTAPGADWQWRIGIADPSNPARVVARLATSNGAVATSGTAQRGHHIWDSRAGAPAGTVVSATVVADSLTAADMWATAAVAFGFDDLSWIMNAGTRSGIIIAPDDATRRWAGQFEIETTNATAANVWELSE